MLNINLAGLGEQYLTLLNMFEHSKDKEKSEHIQWMCSEIIELYHDGKYDKANRWMGFVQGYFWTTGFRTIEQMRKDVVLAREKEDSDDDGCCGESRGNANDQNGGVANAST